MNWKTESTDTCVFVPTSQVVHYHYKLIVDMPCTNFYELVQSQHPVTFVLDLPGVDGDFSGAVWLESWHNISYFFGQMLIFVDEDGNEVPINPFQSCKDQITKLIERGDQ